MTALHLRRPVACPAAQAPCYLERFFAEHAEGDVAVLALRAPIGMPGFPEVTLARDCIVKIARHDRRAAMIAAYDVQWESAGGGPFPRLRGTLSLPNDEDYDSCFLALDGTYEPPLGAAGAAFDAVVGHAVAQTTANDLLERIAEYLEHSYHITEAAKAEKRAARTS
ncbi:MAG TPA: hypothetical protein VMA36_05455 [Candidatus Limnocylindria bacterium]|jgi:hypothetical protein|nr:hypothetical protein [Candidatus Limnocylindria bacterium]